MSLQQALKRLTRLTDWEARSRACMASQVDALPCRDLCRLLGEPQRSFRCVHVAGSKGKGTVSALVGASLQKAGWRTGVVTSPHVEHISERLRLCGTPASDGVHVTL